MRCRSGGRFEAGEPVYAHEGRRCCGTLGYRLRLSAETILAHVAGCRMLLMWLDRRFPGEGRPQPGLGRIMVFATLAMARLHHLEGRLVGGCLSGVVYLGLDVLADWDTAIYFSNVTMTTGGYGTVIMPGDCACS